MNTKVFAYEDLNLPAGYAILFGLKTTGCLKKSVGV